MSEWRSRLGCLELIGRRSSGGCENCRNARPHARMRVRFMRKIPFPRRSVDVTNAGPPGQTFILSGLRTGANSSEEPPLSSADKQDRGWRGPGLLDEQPRPAVDNSRLR